MHQIYVYMKNKSEYIKRVYRRIPFKGGYWFDPDHSLGRDFPAFDRLLAEFRWIKLDFEDRTRIGVCYIDKYGNVIVRYMLKNVLQTKIDF